MAKKSSTPLVLFIRCLALGVLLSMLSVYSLHVYGYWRVENYRPDPETTSTVDLYNTCTLLGDTHILRPNFPVSSLGESVDKTKLAGSFMNFFEGHVFTIILFAAVIGTIVFLVRKGLQTKRSGRLLPS